MRQNPEMLYDRETQFTVNGILHLLNIIAEFVWLHIPFAEHLADSSAVEISHGILKDCMALEEQVINSNTVLHKLHLW